LRVLRRKDEAIRSPAVIASPSPRESGDEAILTPVIARPSRRESGGEAIWVGIFRLWAICAVPAFPGAAKTSFTLELCASFQTSVCSLAPDPMMRSFMTSPPVSPA
jgi:hypothetical protein